ncbi:MAG TPA: hypothetical protein VFE62_22685 [Gemmataceae bacterium]|nr:hypothetical protein [Gemmataceae bacterium]
MTGKRVDGKACKRTAIDPDALAKLVEYRTNPTVAEALKTLGVDWRTISNLIEKEILPVIEDPSGCYTSNRKRRVCKEKVKALKAQQRDKGITKDERGEWLPLKLALKYKNASHKILHKYFNKPCPQLGGAVLRAEGFEQTKEILAKGEKPGPVKKWLRADLKRLKRPKVGMAGRKAAAFAREKATQAEAEKNNAKTPIQHDGHAKIIEAVNGAREDIKTTLGAKMDVGIITTKAEGEKSRETTRAAAAKLGEQIVTEGVETRKVVVPAVKNKDADISPQEPCQACLLPEYKVRLRDKKTKLEPRLWHLLKHILDGKSLSFAAIEANVYGDKETTKKTIPNAVSALNLALEKLGWPHTYATKGGEVLIGE